ncbi:MAG: formate dehydrogenase [Caldimonas sp.]
MKSVPSSPVPRPEACATPPRAGRRLVLGAGAAAAAALAAAAAQRAGAPKAEATAAKTDAAPAEGYRLTDHIRRYYETTRT